jgi:DNA modification methylase
VFNGIKRVLKPSGSFWLNIGDKYVKKNLTGMPWRVAIALQDNGWILRNDIIWEKLKGSQPVKDRFRNSYEHFFHFVKKSKYYFEHKCILIPPRLVASINENGVVSATGVSGKKYRQQIQLSQHLTTEERNAALNALNGVLEEMRRGQVVDFRMTIRGQQRTYHSNHTNVSGRAKELEQKGFFILKSRAAGFMPSDIWRIVPEDDVKGRSESHYAVFPTKLLEIPIKATCPPNGILLDPFAGLGSAIMAGLHYGIRGIGIDLSRKYIKLATKRVQQTQIALNLKHTNFI